MNIQHKENPKKQQLYLEILRQWTGQNLYLSIYRYL